MKKSILDVVESELLTPRGLRSLSPKNEAYEEVCEGDRRNGTMLFTKEQSGPGCWSILQKDTWMCIKNRDKP